MTVTAANIFSSVLAAMKTLLSTCQAFQAWVGVAPGDLGTATGIAAAAARIHLVAFSDTAQAEGQTDAAWRTARAANRPLAVVGFDAEIEGQEQTADEDYWFHRGSLTLLLEAVAGHAGDADAVLDFMNSAGAIFEDLEELNGRAGQLKLVRFSLRTGPGRMPPEDVQAGQLDLVAATWQIGWAEL